MHASAPHLNTAFFRPGLRVAAAVSGGADSVALLRILAEDQPALGIVLSVVHVHHGIRGKAADADAAFVGTLAGLLGLPFHMSRCDAPAAAKERGETLEEAARNLRYTCFCGLIAEGTVDSVATAHTLGDQAETVLAKLLRGAWTEGLSGIHPVLAVPGGAIVRPFLEATRAEIEAWLKDLGQPWREDASNIDLTYTRNRIRHQLLPLLQEFNPGIARQLARLAVVAGDEERYWQAELDRLLPSLLLPGKPVRGGGRSTPTIPGDVPISIELDRIRKLTPAMRRRVLRAAARELGARLSFEQTESLMAFTGESSRHCSPAAGLPAGLRAAKTARELRLTRVSPDSPPRAGREYRFAIPGELVAPEYGLLLRVQLAGTGAPRLATLRNWRPGDRVTPRHSRGPKKVSELLDRLGIRGAERRLWPVVEVDEKIVWMLGVEVESANVTFTTSRLPSGTNDKP